MVTMTPDDADRAIAAEVGLRDGPRDLLLGSASDTVHPSAAGQEVFALLCAQAVIDALTKIAMPAA